MSESHTLALTHDATSWANFLDSAAKMYKYPFADQVLIHAQRPDATACAAMELWNDTFQRRIKRGSKGIALLDDDAQKVHLKYVFDVADTYGAKLPYIWTMEPEHEAAVSDALKAAYEDCSDQGDLKSRILELSRTLAENHNANLLEGDGKARDILASSIGYVVLSRCGLDAEELVENFEGIDRVNDPAEIANLGETAGGLAKDVLSRIERTVKSYEHQKMREQKERGVERDGDTVSAGRGLSGAGPESDGHDGSPDREVRENEENVPQKSQARPLFEPVTQRKVDGTPGGRGGRSDGEDRDDHLGDVEARPAAGQGDEPDGLGGTHEQPAHDGGGDRDEGTDLQLDSKPWKPYRVGDNVYLEKGDRYKIEMIGSDQVIVRLLGLDPGFMIAFNTLDIEDFEKQLGENLFNQAILARKPDSEKRALSYEGSLNEHTGPVGAGINTIPKEFEDVAKESQGQINFGTISSNNVHERVSVTEDQAKVKDAQIQRIATVFGMNESKLREMVNLKLTEGNINEFGRFSGLKDTVDKEKARAFFEIQQGEHVSPLKSNILLDKVLRRFLLEKEFDVDSVEHFPTEQPPSRASDEVRLDTYYISDKYEFDDGENESPDEPKQNIDRGGETDSHPLNGRGFREYLLAHGFEDTGKTGSHSTEHILSSKEWGDVAIDDGQISLSVGRKLHTFNTRNFGSSGICVRSAKKIENIRAYLKLVTSKLD
jgi:hypothetical protein